MTSIDLYAADATLYDVRSNKKTRENSLQHPSHLLDLWCKENRMALMPFYFLYTKDLVNVT